MFNLKKKIDFKDKGKKVIRVDARMEGKLTFNDPVNLLIDASFKGELDTKGTLTIGENAIVDAKIKGDIIVITGEVTGNIKASTSIELISPAKVIGDIKTPLLNIRQGALLKGNCDMPVVEKKGEISQRIKRK